MDLGPDEVKAMRSNISIEGVRQAAKVIAPFVPKSPLMEYPLLTRAIGFPIRLKHENHLPTGAFKIRGGLNYLACMPEDVRAKGVVTATRGNHGQAVALAARHFGMRAVVFVPRGNNPEKNEAMRAYGAELVEHGDDFDEAREAAEKLSRDEGLTFVYNANNPDLINGMGTYTLEILEQWSKVDTIIVPIGGGAGVSGVLTVVRALKPDVRVIGVQTEGAPSVYLSWKNGEIVQTDSAKTYADGLATRVPFSLPFSIIQEGIDEIVTVSDEEIRRANKLIVETTHNLVEGASAAVIAAAQNMGDTLRDRCVVAIMTGANIDQETLRWVLDA